MQKFSKNSAIGGTALRWSGVCPGPGMAKSQRRIPGVTYLLTRRTYQRTFRLRPHEQTNAIVLYCLAQAATQHGVLVHGVVAMSNHLHIVVTDKRGELSDFMRNMHRNMAKALNASQGQWENLWAVRPAGTTRLPTREDVLAKIAYTAANPIIAALVESPDKWPGVLLWKPGSAAVAQRPRVYFGRKRAWPASAELRIVPPPDVREDEREQWREQVHAAVDAAAREARGAVRREGKKFLGAAKVMAKSFLARATSYEDKGQLMPIVAANDPQVLKAELAAEREFQVSYRRALDAWRAGDRTVVFPYGTWWMRVHHKVEVAAAPE